MNVFVFGDIKAPSVALLSDPWQGEAPQLARALLEAKAGQFPAYMTPLEKDVDKKWSTPTRSPVDLTDEGAFDADLTALLGHVEARLKMGLDEAWMSGQG